jgi:RNA polymerase sigma-32 factor
MQSGDALESWPGVVSVMYEHACLQEYLRSIRAIPTLSAEEERRLARAYLRTGDTAAAHQLVTANLRFVVLIARRYTVRGARMADLVQEGNMGLMEAVKRFDPDRGVRLISYASWWIRAHIRQYMVRSVSIVRASVEANRARLEQDLALDDADDGLARLLELATGDEASPEAGLREAQEGAALRRRVAEALARLDERERFVVDARLMADDRMSLREVGTRFGCSQERVQQLQARARKKLWDHLSATVEG